MSYVVKLTSPDGEVFYGSSPDHEGLRYRMTSPDGAEKFETKEKAESVFYWFKQIREISNYTYEAVEFSEGS
jgi:hypothetical protein